MCLNLNSVIKSTKPFLKTYFYKILGDSRDQSKGDSKQSVRKGLEVDKFGFYHAQPTGSSAASNPDQGTLSYHLYLFHFSVF